MNKRTANIILLIMASTWAIISIRIGYLVAVSENFMYLAGILAAWTTAEAAKDAVSTWKDNITKK